MGGLFYHAVGGGGAGHVMRLTAILQAVRSAGSGIFQTLATDAPMASFLESQRIAHIILPAHDRSAFEGVKRTLRTWSHRAATRLLYHAIDTADPVIIVFDTHFSSTLIRKLADQNRKLVLILRPVRASYLQRLLDMSLLEHFAAILVPETQEVFAKMTTQDLLVRLENLGTIAYVGPIVRQIEVSGEQPVPTSRPYLLLVGSGGGHRGEIARITEFIGRVWTRLPSHTGYSPDLLIAGPTAASTDTNRASLIPAENDRTAPRIVDLGWSANIHEIARHADAVICAATYNMTHEALTMGRRLFIAPGRRANEDQCERAHRLAELPGVSIFSLDWHPDHVTAELAKLLGQVPPDPIACGGADAAANAILKICGITNPVLQTWPEHPCPSGQQSWYDLGEGSVSELVKRARTTLAQRADGTPIVFVARTDPGGFAGMVGALADQSLDGFYLIADPARTDAATRAVWRKINSIDPPFPVDILPPETQFPISGRP